MPLGPVRLLAVKFPGSQFRGEIVPALADLVEHGYIRIIDIAFANRDEVGVLTIAELSQLADAEIELFDALVSDISGLIAEEDILSLASQLEPGDSAAILLYEEPWARTFADALRSANAQLVTHEQIPNDIVELALAAAVALESSEQA